MSTSGRARDDRGSMWSNIVRMMGGTTTDSEQRLRQESLPEDNRTGSHLLRVSGVPTEQVVAVEELVKGIAAAATAVWKLQARVDRERREQAFEAPKWLVRQLEAANDALAASGVHARAHTGDKYLPGMAVNVIAFQPQVGTTFEMILETVKPSVFFRDALIQPGDVIVATPVADTSGPPDAQAT